MLRTLLRGVLDALILGITIAGLVTGIWFFGAETFPPLWFFITLLLVLYGLVAWRRWHVWNHALFRVTTERILLDSPLAFFHSPLRTIKWSQYQESYTGHQPLESTQRAMHSDHGSHRHFFDYFFLSRPISIRFGTADAHQEASFPSLRFAEDLKHYLDKVDSAVRRSDVASVKPFVAKGKGKRDVE